MLLSVLIPVYRYDCSSLVASLRSQAAADGVDCEVLTADDEVLQLGRAAVRNHLARQAGGELLLFMDCDATLLGDHFLSDCLTRWQRENKARNAPVVLCPRLCHAEQLPSPEVSLRWRYEHSADKHRSAAERNASPYCRFTTFCFLMAREQFLQVLFDEDCKGYGHEDTLFGAELQHRAIPVVHTDIPLRHDGLEPNAVYLSKTRSAIESLHARSSELDGYSPLLAAARRLERLHLLGIFAWFFRRLRPCMERNLKGSHPSLLLFKLYKLGYYASLHH